MPNDNTPSVASTALFGSELLPLQKETVAFIESGKRVQIVKVPTCQRTIVDKDWTGHSKRKCGKTAYCTQGVSGIPLCGRHYNKWLKKTHKPN
jgi:hypothetical protein